MFYRVTKGGKFRQPCRDCYDMRYYGRKHGERKQKGAAEATVADEQQADAVSAVVETVLGEENAPTGQGEPAETMPEATTETKKRKKNAKQPAAPVESQDEAVIHIGTEAAE